MNMICGAGERPTIIDGGVAREIRDLSYPVEGKRPGAFSPSKGHTDVNMGIEGLNVHLIRPRGETFLRRFLVRQRWLGLPRFLAGALAGRLSDALLVRPPIGESLADDAL